MKKAIVLIVIALLAATLLISASKKEDMLMTALQDPDQQSKLDKLEAYYAQYGSKEDSLSKLLYNHLIKTSLQLKLYDKTIMYGEKSLLLKSVDPNDGFAMDIYRSLSVAYFAQKEFQKAYDMAQKVIDIASLSVDAGARIIYVAPALNLQVAVIDSRSETDTAVKKEALLKAIEAYKADHSNGQYMANILVLGDKLLKLGDIDTVIAQYEQAMQIKPQVELATRLAVLFQKKSDQEKSIAYMKAAYALKSNARIAYNIAAMIQKINVDEALNYLAEAFLLNDPAISPKSEQFLKHLFYNIKNQPPDSKLPAEQQKALIDEQDVQYNTLLNEARTRLGLPPAAPQPPAAAEAPAPVQG
jgi:tetratricopeptide (TPR) repeat protein